MLVVQSHAKIEKILVSGDEALEDIEVCGRVCYKSEERITPGSAAEFVKMLIRRGHLSVLEHSYMRVRFVIDRGISHELVRHRIASYSQESTRYCDYAHGRHGEQIVMIDPRPWLLEDIRCHVTAERVFDRWKRSRALAEKTYFENRADGVPPQLARDGLPTDLKTEVVASMNFVGWRNFFSQRAAAAAHPKMRAIASELLGDVRRAVPVIFDDVGTGLCARECWYAKDHTWHWNLPK